MDGVGSRVGFAGLRSGDIFGFQIRHRHLCIAVNISNYGSCRQFLSPSLSSARFRSVGKGAMKDDDVAKKDSVGSLLRKGKYKFWAVAAILLLAFWSMFTGTVTLKWSTGILVRSDGFDVPVHDDIDILEIEEREKVVRHMWDVYTHNKRIRLPRFWQEAFEAAYEELDSDTASVRDNAVSEIAKMSFRMLTLVPPQTLRAVEVKFLMGLFESVLRQELDTFKREGIRLSVVGNTRKLPLTLQKLVTEAVEATKVNSRLRLIVAVSYSGRSDIVQACQKIACRVRDGELRSVDVDESIFEQQLETSYAEGFSDPDLVIRTSGELRLSNFFLWQLAYSELFFTETFWPDFGKAKYAEALLSYQNRQRRFGKRVEASSEDKGLYGPWDKQAGGVGIS